eukprot:3228231-Amphidinium_carterae.1
MAALTAFKTCTADVVDRVLKHFTDFHSALASKERPKGLNNKLEWLITAILPASMLMSGENLGVSAGCLDADDLKDAETFKKSTHVAGVSLKHQTLQFLMERNFLDKDAVKGSLSKIEPTVRDAPEQQTGSSNKSNSNKHKTALQKRLR